MNKRTNYLASKCTNYVSKTEDKLFCKQKQLVRCPCKWWQLYFVLCVCCNGSSKLCWALHVLCNGGSKRKLLFIASYNVIIVVQLQFVSRSFKSHQGHQKRSVFTEWSRSKNIACTNGHYTSLSGEMDIINFLKIRGGANFWNVRVSFAQLRVENL